MAKEPSSRAKPKGAATRGDPARTAAFATTEADTLEGSVESPSGPTAFVQEQTVDFTLPPDRDDANAGLTARPFEQTEDFTMKPREDEDAADYLLSDGDDEAPATTGKTKAGPRVDADGDSDFDLNLEPPGDTDAGAESVPAPKKAKPAKTQQMSEDEVEKAARKPAAAKSAGPATKKVPAKPASKESPGEDAELVLGDYKLVKVLGQGGMGKVYRAHQESLDRIVAVKVLSKELSSRPAFVQRFQREAKVMVKLDHPNILNCYGLGQDKGYHFLALEFVEGGSIENWLKKLGKFSVGDALHIILCVCRALEHAHELNLIHRDIKPDNILLTKKGVVKVADLGLAKATDDDLSLTKTGTGAGTPLYMAPEQARDVKHVDGRADIFAIGVMLYVFLAGEPPFKGETLVELIEAKEIGKFKPIRKFNADCPERLDLIVSKMLQSKPDHRYPTCTEIIEEIEALGLHNDALSFLEATSSSQAKTVSAKPKKPGEKTSKPAAAASTKAPAGKVGATLATGEEFYFWQMLGDDNKPVTKKLKKGQLVALIKSGSLDAQEQVSKTPKGGYRSLGTYVEFQQYFKGAATKEKAEKKGDKFREMYKQIEAEETSRQRWRWIHNLTLRAGGFVGLLLWLAVVAGVVVGGYFLVRFLLNYFGETMQKTIGS